MKLINNIKKNTFIILILTIIILYVILKDEFLSITNLLLKVDLRFIFICFILFLMSIFLQSFVLYKTINNKKISLKEAFKLLIIIQFFNGITPFSSGGQPMEIYLLTKKGINANKGTMIVLQNFIFYQFALVLFGICAVTYNYIFKIFPASMLLKKLVIFGFLINTLVAIGIILISISKKFTTIIVNLGIKMLSKLKLIKDVSKTKNSWMSRLDEFHDCAKYLRTRKKLFIGGIIFNFLSLACLYIIPLFIVYSMHDYHSLNVLNTLTSSAYVLLIGAFVPIPGASGGIEYGFSEFFGTFLAGTVTKTVLLIWRFITYYFGMLLGAIIFNLKEDDNKCE